MTSAITEDQWQAMLKLACEVGELPPDPAVRRKRLATGLCELVGGETAHSFEIRGSNENDLSRSEGKFSLPLDPTQLQGMRAYFKDGEHHLIAMISLSDGAALGVRVHRAPHDKPFTQDDCDVLSAFHLHAWRLYGCATKPAELDPAVKSLPPRLRPVLHELLTTGDGEKQIAMRLKLSRHTVHQYVKSLYARLGVSSRAELMHRFGAPTSPAPSSSVPTQPWMALAV